YFDDGKLVITYLIVKRNDIVKYKWARFFDKVFSKGEVLEKHVIDAKNKILIGCSINLSARRHLNVHECVEFKSNADFPDKTTLYRNFTVSSLFFSKSFASQYVKRMKMVLY
ncbi:hypothetical protein MXB_116, partial [Myxobolus squamalis]